MNLITQKGYAFRLFVALSLVLCAIFGGRVYESACAAAWRLRYSKDWYKYYWANTTIWLMELLEPAHCYKSWLWYQKVLCGLDITDGEEK